MTQPGTRAVGAPDRRSTGSRSDLQALREQVASLAEACRRGPAGRAVGSRGRGGPALARPRRPRPSAWRRRAAPGGAGRRGSRAWKGYGLEPRGAVRAARGGQRDHRRACPGLGPSASCQLGPAISAGGALRPRDGELPGRGARAGGLGLRGVRRQAPGAPSDAQRHSSGSGRPTSGAGTSSRRPASTRRRSTSPPRGAHPGRAPSPRAWRSGRSIGRIGRATSGPGSSATFPTATPPFVRARSSAQPGDPSAHRSLDSRGSRSTLRHN